MSKKDFVLITAVIAGTLALTVAILAVASPILEATPPVLTETERNEDEKGEDEPPPSPEGKNEAPQSPTINDNIPGNTIIYPEAENAVQGQETAHTAVAPERLQIEAIYPDFKVIQHADQHINPSDPSEWDNATELARLIWGEACGVASVMERAAVIWCVLNRVDDPRWPDTVEEVVRQKRQFVGHCVNHPALEENIAIAVDVLMRWALEKIGVGDAGRVLPAEYVFFTGDGQQNYFTKAYPSERAAAWTWELRNPYPN